MPRKKDSPKPIGDRLLTLGEACARLRYSSEGGHLRQSGRGAIAALFRRAFGNLPRPESWFPYVFTSIDDPRLKEVIGGSILEVEIE